MQRRHIRPPVPGRHADRARQFIGAIGGAAPVAADDQQRAGHAGRRPLDRQDQETLPRALQLRDIDPLVRHQPVDRFIMAQRADPYLRCAALGRAGDPANILLQILGGDSYHGVFGRVGDDPRRLPPRHQREIPPLRHRPHPVRRLRRRGAEQQQRQPPAHQKRTMLVVSIRRSGKSRIALLRKPVTFSSRKASAAPGIFR